MSSHSEQKAACLVLMISLVFAITSKNKMDDQHQQSITSLPFLNKEKLT
jgi:hypothetical protein